MRSLSGGASPLPNSTTNSGMTTPLRHDGVPAAVVGDDLAGNIMRRVAGQIDDEADQIVRHAAMAHGDAGLDRLFELLDPLGSGRGAALGAERSAAVPAGRDGVDADFLLGVFGRDLPGEADDAGLGGGIADRHGGE